jgi:hypothetical protein
MKVTPLGRRNPNCETNIKTDLKLMNCDDDSWIELAKVYVNLLNLWNFMTFMIIFYIQIILYITYNITYNNLCILYIKYNYIVL